MRSDEVVIISKCAIAFNEFAIVLVALAVLLLEVSKEIYMFHFLGI